ncbi:unnamed protein product [Periconia digitata]|uniref:Uncharacterized protein n=1 Tax=Periconia digitata TaxID=1303443 RepID=A0A9W4UKM7_9PLEO|nr:unnamed protein product [Periconia digitata]
MRIVAASISILAAIGVVAALPAENFSKDSNIATAGCDNQGQDQYYNCNGRTRCYIDQECGGLLQSNQSTNMRYSLMALSRVPNERKFQNHQPISCVLWVKGTPNDPTDPILPMDPPQGLCFHYRNLVKGQFLPALYAKLAALDFTYHGPGQGCPYCGVTPLSISDQYTGAELYIDYTRRPCDLGGKDWGACPASV